MLLSKNIADYFDPGVRSRGETYAGSRSVHIVSARDGKIHATVSGGDEYDVWLYFHQEHIHIYCSCPHYLGGDFCKHVWATIVAAEQRGHLPTVRPSDYIEIFDETSPDFFESDEDVSEDDPEGDLTEPGIFFPPMPKKPFLSKPGAATTTPPQQSWKAQFENVRMQLQSPHVNVNPGLWSENREIHYFLDVPTTIAQGVPTLEIRTREPKKNGEWGKWKAQRIPAKQIPVMPDEGDRRLMGFLSGGKDVAYSHYSTYLSNEEVVPFRMRLNDAALRHLLPFLCATGRFHLMEQSEFEDLPPAVEWDDAKPWELCVDVEESATGKNYQVTGTLRRDEERMDLGDPVLLLASGLVFTDTKAALLNHFDAFYWIALLRRGGFLRVPREEGEKFVQELLNFPKLPRLSLPDELRFEIASVTPRPGVKIKPPPRRQFHDDKLWSDPFFLYGDREVRADEKREVVVVPGTRTAYRRDAATERTALDVLRQLGFQNQSVYAATGYKDQLVLAPKKLAPAVRTLMNLGWIVEAEGKLYRRASVISNIAVSSGIDWFELHGEADFEGVVVKLPDLLAALKRGETTVPLGDGTVGLLPEDWLNKYGLLAGLGTKEGDHVRFRRSQAGLLDALLASLPEAKFDEAFRRVRDRLHGFDGVAPADPPPGFRGTLRNYQREGLGWLRFLDEFEFGGILADDMGLGKTIQVLALLDGRRLARASGEIGPDVPRQSLVVVPRSLVFNWKQEAEKFAPELRVLDHTGQTRAEKTDAFADADVVLTTYGTMRSDVLMLKEYEFDYVILDEGQAIKNAKTEGAKAARLLRGRRRLVMSGTPIENHLGDLWSLMEFLNPGMLGAASVFQAADSKTRTTDEESRKLLARALKPFILRRTKEQVAPDLPPKLEQTIYCEMDPKQRKLYDDLRDYYRANLLQTVKSVGLAKSKILVLEALLRLRQAACHPALLDTRKTTVPSAKFDALLPQLEEVIEEGHKVLVFSQFTSLLALLRKHLDKEKIVYEYLDGQTRDRAARVERFQSDPKCPLFLISLKAGGFGLNLTAADYVFLLDPWWNPAVESQAIDRTHRIGQDRHVFAYRLIVRDTVEEKVIQLQETKRDLADAIINADNSLIRTLAVEDLDLLLS